MIAQKNISDDNKIDQLLKDYTSTLGSVILAAKSSQLHFIADSIEVIWKFLLVSLDRLIAVKQRQLEGMFNEELTKMHNKIEFLTASLKESDKRFSSMNSYYENRIKKLLEKNRHLGENIIDLRQEIQKIKGVPGSELREDKDTLLGRFEIMRSDIESMKSSINEANELNHQQNKMVRKELLTSIMGIFNKGFQCNSKQASTQTDLSLCGVSNIVYKYGIEETVMPETQILASFRHPFLPFLFEYNDSIKPNMEEQINFIEQNLDHSK